MDSVEYFILVLNLVLGIGFGWLLAGRFTRLAGDRSGRMREFVFLLLVYLLESATDLLRWTQHRTGSRPRPALRPLLLVTVGILNLRTTGSGPRRMVDPE